MISLGTQTVAEVKTNENHPRVRQENTDQKQVTTFLSEVLKTRPEA